MEKAKITSARPYSDRPPHFAFVSCNIYKNCTEVKLTYPINFTSNRAEYFNQMFLNSIIKLTLAHSLF